MGPWDWIVWTAWTAFIDPSAFACNILNPLFRILGDDRVGPTVMLEIFAGLKYHSSSNVDKFCGNKINFRVDRQSKSFFSRIFNFADRQSTARNKKFSRMTVIEAAVFIGREICIRNITETRSETMRENNTIGSQLNRIKGSEQVEVGRCFVAFEGGSKCFWNFCCELLLETFFVRNRMSPKFKRLELVTVHV